MDRNRKIGIVAGGFVLASMLALAPPQAKADGSVSLSFGLPDLGIGVSGSWGHYARWGQPRSRCAVGSPSVIKKICRR